jgi:hypothetical protein
MTELQIIECIYWQQLCPLWQSSTSNSSNMKGSMKFPKDEPTTVQWHWLGKHLSIHGTKWKLCSMFHSPSFTGRANKIILNRIERHANHKKATEKRKPKIKEQRKQKQRSSMNNCDHVHVDLKHHHICYQLPIL